MTRDGCRRVRFSGKGAAESSRGKSLEDAGSGAGKLRSATCAHGAKRGWGRGEGRSLSKEVVPWMAGIQEHWERRRVGPTTSAIFQFAIEPSSYAGYFGTPVWRCNIFHTNSGNNKRKEVVDQANKLRSAYMGRIIRNLCKSRYQCKTLNNSKRL